LLPCTSVLQQELIHLYQTSSLLPDHFPIEVSVSLRLLYVLLYSGHIKHFQVLGFLPFPYSSCMHSPPSVWPMSNITASVLHLKSAYEDVYSGCQSFVWCIASKYFLPLCEWLFSLETISFIVQKLFNFM
jgi:hypothetical protein